MKCFVYTNGRSAGSLPTYDEMARLLHPEDRDRTNEAVQNAFRDKAEMVLDFQARDG